MPTDDSDPSKTITVEPAYDTELFIRHGYALGLRVVMDRLAQARASRPKPNPTEGRTPER